MCGAGEVDYVMARDMGRIDKPSIRWAVLKDNALCSCSLDRSLLLYLHHREETC